MSDFMDNIIRSESDPRNVIARIKEILGDWYDVRAIYYPEILTNIYHIYNSSSGITVRVDITEKMADELGLLLPEFIVNRVRVETMKETLKKQVDEPLTFPKPTKPTPLIAYFNSKENK